MLTNFYWSCGTEGGDGKRIPNFSTEAEAKGPIWRPWQEDNINMHLKETECIDTELEEFKKNHIKLSYNSSEKKNTQNAK